MSGKKADKLKKKREEEEEEESEEEENEEEEDDEEDEEEGAVLLDLDDLPKAVANRVRNLLKIQESADTIHEEYQAERMALERKYIERRQALYESRRQIVSGEVEPPVLPTEEEGESAAATTEEEGESPKGIPQFWPTVLSVHPAINQYITEDDIPVLEHLTDITCTTAEDFTSFTLNFHFSENAYFSNGILTKKYTVSPHLLDDESPNLSGMEGATIEWKEGKNLCEEVTTKKQRAKSGRNKGQVRTVTVKTPKQSFFQFFSPVSNQVDDEDEEEEEDEEARKKKEKEMMDKDGVPVKIDPESDYDIGHAIRTSLIPEAVRWFTGEAAQEYDAMYGGYGDDDEDEEGNEEGDDEEESDEEDEEEEDEKPKKKGGKGGKKGKGGAADAAANGEKPPECKQN